MPVNVDKAHFDIWKSILDESSRRNPEPHRLLQSWIFLVSILLASFADTAWMYHVTTEFGKVVTQCEQLSNARLFGLPVNVFFDAIFVFIWLGTYIAFQRLFGPLLDYLFGRKRDLVHRRLENYDTAQGVELAKKVLSKFGNGLNVAQEFETSEFQDALAAYLFHH